MSALKCQRSHRGIDDNNGENHHVDRFRLCICQVGSLGLCELIVRDACSDIKISSDLKDSIRFVATVLG